MALKTYKPTSPAQRQLVTVDRSQLWNGKPFKTLTEGLTKSGGRNNTGRITSRHIGGGHKRKYRIIDFKRDKFDMSADVLRLEYDPNRTSFIALVKYEDGEHRYIIAPQRLAEGDKIISSDNADIKVGNSLPIKNIPVGTIIHNVELKPKAGAQLCRSAGSYVQIVGRDGAYVQLRLPSGELRLVHGTCRGTIGTVSNADHKNINLSKAGRSRWLGRRPKVRGVVMNPVDHPHGGGEGRTSGGRHPVTPWGVPTKGKKTRDRKKQSSKFIITRRKKR